MSSHDFVDSAGLDEALDIAGIEADIPSDLAEADPALVDEPADEARTNAE